jgi:hypothetical protein
MSKFKPYKPIFESTDSKSKGKSKVARRLEKAIRSLKEAKKTTRRLREEDESAEDVVDALEVAIDAVEDVITGLIDEVGATDPAVATLIDTVADLEIDQEIAEEKRIYKKKEIIIFFNYLRVGKVLLKL